MSHPIGWQNNSFFCGNLAEKDKKRRLAADIRGKDNVFLGKMVVQKEIITFRLQPSSHYKMPQPTLTFWTTIILLGCMQEEGLVYLLRDKATGRRWLWAWVFCLFVA